MSCLQNEMLLETLFEEALEEVTNNNHLQFNDEEKLESWILEEINLSQNQ